MHHRYWILLGFASGLFAGTGCEGEMGPPKHLTGDFSTLVHSHSGGLTGILFSHEIPLQGDVPEIKSTWRNFQRDAADCVVKTPLEPGQQKAINDQIPRIQYCRVHVEEHCTDGGGDYLRFLTEAGDYQSGVTTYIVKPACADGDYNVLCGSNTEEFLQQLEGLYPAQAPVDCATPP